MKKKSLKLSLVVFLIFLMLGLTFTSFAYWDQLTKTDDLVVTIGQGKEVNITATATVPSDKVLVPTGAIIGPHDVTSVNLQYTVELSQEVSSDLTLSVVASGVKIGEDISATETVPAYDAEAYASLVNIVISPETVSSLNSDSPVTVNVTVSLTEPLDTSFSGVKAADIYASIINKPITFTLTFSAAQ
mgnify:CR=1 FL=1